MPSSLPLLTSIELVIALRGGSVANARMPGHAVEMRFPQRPYGGLMIGFCSPPTLSGLPRLVRGRRARVGSHIVARRDERCQSASDETGPSSCTTTKPPAAPSPQRFVPSADGLSAAPPFEGDFLVRSSGCVEPMLPLARPGVARGVGLNDYAEVEVHLAARDYRRCSWRLS